MQSSHLLSITMSYLPLGNEQHCPYWVFLILTDPDKSSYYIVKHCRWTQLTSSKFKIPSSRPEAVNAWDTILRLVTCPLFAMLPAALGDILLQLGALHQSASFSRELWESPFTKPPKAAGLGDSEGWADTASYPGAGLAQRRRLGEAWVRLGGGRTGSYRKGRFNELLESD